MWTLVSSERRNDGYLSGTNCCSGDCGCGRGYPFCLDPMTLVFIVAFVPPQ